MSPENSGTPNGPASSNQPNVGSDRGPSEPIPFDYQAPENHINQRHELSFGIRQTLPVGSVREDWAGHPRSDGSAGFWQSVHRDLLKGSAAFTKGFQSLLDVPETELDQKHGVQRLTNYGASLISFAHHHHEIEDHNYFPQIRALYPQIDHAMTLLDCDHRILDEALNDTELALANLSQTTATRDQIAAIYKGGQALDKILNRHIWDEEDIVIPILLAHG